MVLGGRRKNKKEGGNVIEEEIERTKKNNRIIIFYLKLFINDLYSQNFLISIIYRVRATGGLTKEERGRRTFLKKISTSRYLV